MRQPTQNGPKWVPKWYQYQNINSGNYLLHFVHMGPSRIPPKIDGKTGHYTNWPKMRQPTQNGPKWTPFFAEFCQKWYQNLMWIPRWPQRTPGDPKMDPQDLKMVQKWSKMTPKSTQNGSKMKPTWNQNHKEKRLNYITIPEPDWTLLQTFRNQLARRYTSRRLLKTKLITGRRHG